MLYQYVKRYLKKQSKNPTVDLKWSSLDNIQFFNHIDARYTEAEFEKEISEVKQAFKDFFEPVGKIIFKYKRESGVKFKIFPYSVDPKNSKHLKKLVQIIQNNRKYIKYPYQGQNDQIAILGKIRRDINREIYDTDESVNQKELVKYAIKEALELGKSDIVTQLKRKYIVKIFEQSKALENESQGKEIIQREGIQKRFNGYTPEEIESTYKEIFVDGNSDIEYFLANVLKIVFSNDLNFELISNEYYEEYALKIIHKAISQELSNYSDLEEDYLVGVAGFLMRKYFYKIHELMAIKIIELIYEKNNNATNFLFHYDGSVVLINYKKYQRPSLVTESGQQWNNASLVGICNLWMNTKKKKRRYEQKLAGVNEKVKQLDKTLEHVRPEKERHERNIKAADVKLEALEKQHSEIESKLKYLESTNLNSNEYFKALENFNQSELNVKKIKEARANDKNKLAALKDANASAFQELEYMIAQKQQLIEDIKRAQDLNIDTKSSQIDPIIDSVVKVLMQRTKLL